MDCVGCFEIGKTLSIRGGWHPASLPQQVQFGCVKLQKTREDPFRCKICTSCCRQQQMSSGNNGFFLVVKQKHLVGFSCQQKIIHFVTEFARHVTISSEDWSRRFTSVHTLPSAGNIIQEDIFLKSAIYSKCVHISYADRRADPFCCRIFWYFHHIIVILPAAGVIYVIFLFSNNNFFCSATTFFCTICFVYANYVGTCIFDIRLYSFICRYMYVFVIREKQKKSIKIHVYIYTKHTQINLYL